jgi:hypothetical protein
MKVLIADPKNASKRLTEITPEVLMPVYDILQNMRYYWRFYRNTVGGS